MDSTLDHLKAKEIGRHQLQVTEIKRRAHQWRLTDCSVATLGQMRHALIEEMQTLEQRLAEANDHFLLYVENARPLDTEKSLQRIDHLSREWEKLNEHLQDVDEALLERHLRSRLIGTLGGARRLNLLEAAVFISIIVIVALTALELTLPLSAQMITWITVSDTIISLFLIAEFFLRLSLSEDKGWYFRRYWIDLLASIPFHQVLSFGPLVPAARFARLLRLLRLGRAVRVLLFAFRGLDKLFQTLQLNLLKRSLLIALALLFFGALSISAVERGPEVAGMGESMWWSFATVVTGGFADLYNPSTLPGRIVTVGLVLLGLTVTGIFTASLTSVLVESESSRLEQNQQELETHLGVINQKLDLLSSTTNEGLIALETASQALSNQSSRADIARVLAETMMGNFECIQASIHLLRPAADGRPELIRVYEMGMAEATPPQRVQPGMGFTGRVVAELLQQNHFAELDLEPETEPRLAIKGLAMICPLVAGRRPLGLLHVVLPESLGRYYLYNRVPMTLAHHAAMAFYAADLAEQNGD